jgi:hypothetical protein
MRVTNLSAFLLPLISYAAAVDLRSITGIDLGLRHLRESMRIIESAVNLRLFGDDLSLNTHNLTLRVRKASVVLSLQERAMVELLAACPAIADDRLYQLVSVASAIPVLAVSRNVKFDPTFFDKLLSFSSDIEYLLTVCKQDYGVYQ